jgi:hypothetical protein
VSKSRGEAVNGCAGEGSDKETSPETAAISGTAGVAHLAHLPLVFFLTLPLDLIGRSSEIVLLLLTILHVVIITLIMIIIFLLVISTNFIPLRRLIRTSWKQRGKRVAD